ncbi:MAG TPA: hypothetical protein VK021_11015 [Flavobacteriaceae bacterium]|nr:hypothetical protein [Flavobacteriaceae bacterium]
MLKKEKKVFYESSNTYSTLNKLTSKTENIWIVCHGLGYLSRYFIPYFKSLEVDKNYIIAPQAPSKYYQDRKFKYVGASWLTKEDTKEETKNIMTYLDAIYEAEQIPNNKNLILFGFSQGVSVSMRWMAKRKIEPAVLVIYAGRIPEELTVEDFAYLKNTTIKMVYGREDPFITPKRLERQRLFAEKLFGKKQLEIIPFEGKHEVKPEIIQQIGKTI